MARRVITQSVYQALLTAYRAQPGNHSYASKMAGVTWATAKKGYKDGWTKAYAWAAPIEVVLKEESDNVRAERARQQEADRLKDLARRDAVRQDAVTANQEETNMVTNLRRNSLVVTSITAKLLQGIVPLAARGADLLRADTEASAKDILSYITSVIAILKLSGASVNDAMNAERLRVGNPLQAIGAGPIADVSRADALLELEGLMVSIERASLKNTDGTNVDLN